MERLDARLHGDSLEHVSDRLGGETLRRSGREQLGGVFPASREIRRKRSRGVRREPDADAGIVHECENCVVAFLEIVGTTAIDGGSESVELVGFEPDAHLNFGVYIIPHE